MTDLGRGRVLVSSDFGDYALLSRDEADALQAGGDGLASSRRLDLLARGLIEGSGAVPDLDAAVLRTRKAFLLEGPTLHISTSLSSPCAATTAVTTARSRALPLAPQASI
jgi:hypothetical protein